MNREAALRFLEFMENLVELAEFKAASGLVIELRTPSGYSQLIGPFRKDTADVFAAAERLRSEESPDEAPNTYTVKLLFPASYAALPGDQTSVLPDMGVSDEN